MPNFRIVVTQACDAGTWLDTWSAEYDKSSGNDETEYTKLIELSARTTDTEGFYERIGRWKDSANSDRRWQPNVASVAYPIWQVAEQVRPTCPVPEQVIPFLENWSSKRYEDTFQNRTVTKRFGLSRATTLLHFLSRGRLPIYDSNVIEAMHLLYESNPVYTAVYYWNVFYPQFQALACECGTEDYRKLDKALFSYGAAKLSD